MVARQYQAGDEHRVSARADFRAAYEANGRRLHDGPKWTLLDDGGVVAIGGVEPLGGRSWAAWAYCADLTPRQWVKAASVAKILLGGVQVKFQPQFLAVEPEAFPGAWRLLQRIGFVPTPDSPDILVLETA